MSVAKDLEIYKAAEQLLQLGLKVQAQIPRAYRVAVGQRISNECADILLRVARANAGRGESRQRQIEALLEHLEAITVLMHDPRADVELRGSRALLAKVPPHKSLFNAPADTGLPIGNLSSQFFANIHLDALDQFAKHQLKARHYVRYVDDFVLLDRDPQVLRQALSRIEAWLPERLGGRLNPKKTILQPVDRGIDFVGQVIKPWCRTLRPRTLATAKRRLVEMDSADTFTAGNSYLGLLRQATHHHTDSAAVAKLLMQRGHAVAGDFSKIFRKAAQP